MGPLVHGWTEHSSTQRTRKAVYQGHLFLFNSLVLEMLPHKFSESDKKPICTSRQQPKEHNLLPFQTYHKVQGTEKL